MGKTLLVLLHAVWEDPCNAAEVLAIGDGDTLSVKEGSQTIKVRLCLHSRSRDFTVAVRHNSKTNTEESSTGWI